MARIRMFIAAACLATPALAQEPADESPASVAGALDVSAEIGLVSDYRFRGVSRSDEDPAAHAAVDVGLGSGLYAGARGTTLKGVDSFRLRDPGAGDLGDLQVELYAGWLAPLGGGFELDAGLLYYLFPDGEGASDHVEPYASLSYLIGPVQATAGAKYAPAQAALGDEDRLYLFGQADFALPFRPWRFSAQLGHQDWGRFGGYWTWSLGVEHQLQALPGAALSLRYVDTDLPSGPGQDAGLVAGLAFRF